MADTTQVLPLETCLDLNSHLLLHFLLNVQLKELFFSVGVNDIVLICFLLRSNKVQREQAQD